MHQCASLCALRSLGICCCVNIYLSRAGLLLLLSSTEATEPLPSRTDWTIATGRTGGSEEHTSQEEEEEEVSAMASPPPTLPPFPAPLTPGLTGSSLMSIRHFSLLAKSEYLTLSHTTVKVCLGCFLFGIYSSFIHCVSTFRGSIVFGQTNVTVDYIINLIHGWKSFVFNDRLKSGDHEYTLIRSFIPRNSSSPSL